MRILITADLHYRPSQREAYLNFSHWVKAQAPDCLIIAGDVGHPLRLFRRALQLFADLDCPKLVLAGNHDVYKGEHDSRTLWEIALPQATREEGFGWLEDEVVVLGVSKELGGHETGWIRSVRAVRNVKCQVARQGKANRRHRHRRHHGLVRLFISGAARGL